jgi:hypothetical protein
MLYAYLGGLRGIPETTRSLSSGVPLPLALGRYSPPVCMYVCMYVLVYVCKCVCMYVVVYVCMCVCMYVLV